MGVVIQFPSQLNQEDSTLPKSEFAKIVDQRIDNILSVLSLTPDDFKDEHFPKMINYLTEVRQSTSRSNFEEWYEESNFEQTLSNGEQAAALLLCFS